LGRRFQQPSQDRVTSLRDLVVIASLIAHAGEDNMAETTVKAVPQLQTAAEQFHMWMGYCIAEWAYIDDYFFSVCHAALECPKQQAAIVYYKTPNFEARITLADELVKTVLPRHKPGDKPHEDLSTWIAAYKAVEKIKPNRNRIAHCHTGVAASAILAEGRGEEVEVDAWYFLYESNNQKLRGKPIPPPLALSDLRSHYYEVAKVRNLLHVFYYDRLPKHVSVPPPR
jgi:hypothetical protein